MPNFLTSVLVLVGTVLGVTVAFSLQKEYSDVVAEVVDFADPRAVLGLLFGGIGYLVASTIAWEFQRWFERKLPNLRMRDFLWGGAGLFFGLVIANLTMLPVLVIMFNRYFSDLLNRNSLTSVIMPVTVIMIPLTLNVLLGYLGMVIFVRKQSELYGIFTSKLQPAANPGVDLKILDTSAIIDGRIVDLLPTGILDGRLSVPLFVLNELQLLADSSDQNKRLRGQRGFDILEKLKTNDHVLLELPPIDYHELQQVDAKLIEFAKETGGKLVTNDFALNKLAKLQEIDVINMNEVSNALRPVVLAGEKFEILIVKRGKGPQQGVGYLNDGTMVVVEGGAPFQGETRVVVVTNVQQSSVGRMVFATLATDGGRSEG